MTLVTVIIPARNEETALGSALTSVLDQTYPLDSIEVVVVDGASSDATPAVAKELLDGTPLHRWEVLNNPEASTPSNLNAGLAWANGDIVVRVDARSALPAHYVNQVVTTLRTAHVAAVGGRQVARPLNKSLEARSIARALNNPIANGGARYRDHRATSGECETAYLGVFRADELRTVGGWNLDFSSNQDFELCQRMAQFGTIEYDADLPVTYQPRPTFKGLFRQYRRFGRWKVRYWSSTGDRPQPRQVALLATPGMTLAAGIAVFLASPTVAAPAAVAGIGGLIAVDAVGQEQPAEPAERLGAAIAMALIGIGWWSGAAQEAMAMRFAEGRARPLPTKATETL